MIIYEIDLFLLCISLSKKFMKFHMMILYNLSDIGKLINGVNIDAIYYFSNKQNSESLSSIR